MDNQSDLLKLSLRPIDTLFFRDARPFGPAGQAKSRLPMPQTLAGAIRTLLLEAHDVNLDQFGEHVRSHGSFDQALRQLGGGISKLGEVAVAGPWLCKDGQVLAPIPANLKYHQTSSESDAMENVVRLDPLRTPPHGWQHEERGLLPLWHYGRESLRTFSNCYLTPDGIQEYLTGGTPKSDDIVKADELYMIDHRVGIGIDGSLNTAAESLIYSAGMLSLKQGVTFYAEVRGDSITIDPLNQPGLLLKFGGEGKCVEVLQHSGTAWPVEAKHNGDGHLLVLTTPAWFNGWKPSQLPCIAAAVPGFDGISGWDLALGGPKPNRFMVRAGSVYFLPNNESFPRELVEHDDALIGWGHYLKGTWKYV